MADRPLRLPRPLHPGAWWLWALGLATAASRTTNPILLGLLLAVAASVVAARRGDAPWAKGFKAYLIMGLVVIGFRVVLRMLLDAQYGTTILFTLPELKLPESAAGIRLGGAVSAEGVLAAFYDGLRLATLLACVGAANVLANPKRLLKAMPAALHEISVAVIVALTVAPQLVESAQRIHRARKLRGENGRRMRLVRRVVLPVLTDALDRSLLLAAAMDSRGYGRSADVPRRTRIGTGVLVLGGLGGVCVGAYNLLDATTPAVLGLPMLAIGLVLAGVGFVLGGRRVVRSRYRPDPWEGAEWAVASAGLAVAAVFVVGFGFDVLALDSPVQPLGWPTLPVVPVLACLLGTLPAVLAPPVRLPTSAADVGSEHSSTRPVSRTPVGNR